MLNKLAAERWRRFVGLAEKTFLDLTMTLIVLVAEQMLSRRMSKKGS